MRASSPTSQVQADTEAPLLEQVDNGGSGDVAHTEMEGQQPKILYFGLLFDLYVNSGP